jgi:hypothetical protein
MRKAVSVTKAVAFQIGDGAVIQVGVPPGNTPPNCDWEFFVNGKPRTPNKSFYQKAGLAVTQAGEAWVFEHTESGGQIIVTKKRSGTNGCVMAYQVCLPNGEMKIAGLLGTPNGVKEDEWTLPNGSALEVPTDSRSLKFEPAHKYCIQWCVPKGESMFTYTGDMTWDSVNLDCKADFDPAVENAVKAGIPADILAECGEGDEFLDCQIDGIIGGVEDAKNFKAVEQELDELKEAPPLPPPEAYNENAGTVCTGPTGRFSGDPHLITFDKVYYDCQGKGEFVVVDANGPHGSFKAQARYMYGAVTSVSVTKSVVFQFPNAPKIQIDVPEAIPSSNCDYSYYIDDEGKPNFKSLKNNDHITATFVGSDTIAFDHPISGARVEISKKVSKNNGCVLAFQMCIPEDTTSRGLLGVPNDLPDDDWTKPDGTVVDIPESRRDLRFEPALTYCKSWCIDAPNTPNSVNMPSMFKYTNGKDHAYYSDCAAPFDDGIEIMITNIPPEILEFCGEEDDGCIIDGIGGDKDDAKNLKGVERELDVLKVAPPKPASISIDKTVLLAGQNVAPPSFCNPGKEIVQGMSGQNALYCYEVTNTGGEPLSNIKLGDDCLGFSHTRSTPLPPGASFRVPFSHVMTADMSATNCDGTVVAEAGEDVEVSDSDPAGHAITESEVDCTMDITNTVVGGQVMVNVEEKCTYCVCA